MKRAPYPVLFVALALLLFGGFERLSEEELRNVSGQKGFVSQPTDSSPKNSALLNHLRKQGLKSLRLGRRNQTMAGRPLTEIQLQHAQAQQRAARLRRKQRLERRKPDKAVVKLLRKVLSNVTLTIRKGDNVARIGLVSDQSGFGLFADFGEEGRTSFRKEYDSPFVQRTITGPDGKTETFKTE